MNELKSEVKKINKQLLKQIIRFLFVGGTAFVIDFGVLWILTEAANINYLLSNCISFVASVIYNYIMSVLWVFNTDKTKKKSTELIIFMVLSIIGLGINQLLMWVMVDKISIHYLFSKMIATIIVMIYNFVTRKHFLEAD